MYVQVPVHKVHLIMNPSFSQKGRKPSPKPDEIHEKAKEIFMNGVWCEQNGLIYEGLFLELF